MATLPRATLSSKLETQYSHPRISSDFDAGINASVAWTEHLDRNSSFSDDDEPNEHEGKPARVLYDFKGKDEFGELTVQAGDTLAILKLDLWDGWSLAKPDKAPQELGLVPREYFVLTTEFTPSPSVFAIHAKQAENDASVPSLGTALEPLQIQPTGTANSSTNTRQSWLGGMSLNRFSSFVTTGAEEFLLNGSEELGKVKAEESEEEEYENYGNGQSAEVDSQNEKTKPDRHFVETPPAWKSKSPPFQVLVHSPSKRTSSITGAYTIYAITSLFPPSHSRYSSSSSTQSTSTSSASTIESPHVTVYRRFSQFTFLHDALSRRLPGIALPPLPEKQYAGRFSDEFVEARRGDLERWINRVVRHPLARYTDVLVFFLGCESEIEWRRELPKFLAAPQYPPSPSFYAHVFHPEFNLDAEDAADTVNRFERHLAAVGKSMQSLRSVFGKVRESEIVTSTAQRTLSYALLSLITSTPLSRNPNLVSPSLAYGGIYEDEEVGEHGKHLEGKEGLLNGEGAWCWREDCEDCLRLTKALQKTAESLQSVADIYDDHARRTQFATHDTLKDVAHPKELYSSVVEIHRATLSRYNDATSNPSDTGEDIVARCETVLNTTMAEFDTYHTQKVEDFEKIAVEHLDGEIALHEQILARLRQARSAFESGSEPILPPGPRQPSIYERDLTTPELASPRPLNQPAPHVYDSVSKMRPVNVAIRESIGVLFSPGGTVGRGSMFGRLWG